MSWYNTEGKEPQNVVYSETRYKRNPSDVPFPLRAGDKLTEPYYEKIDALLIKNGFRREPLTSGGSIQLCALAEKGFIDYDQLRGGSISVYFNEPCSLAVTLGGRDHLTIRSLIAGRAITESRNIAAGAEELLDGELEFAYNERVGYMSALPSQCGSGALFSSLLYLPAIASHHETDRILQLCQQYGVAMAPLTATHKNAGELFLFSRSPSHLSDESKEAEGFDSFIGRLIDEERNLEHMLYDERLSEIADKAWRAYGSLLYARLLDERDLLSLSSDIRLAHSLCRDNVKLPPVAPKELNRLLGECMNFSIAVQSFCADRESCMRLRAETVSRLLYSPDEGKEAQ